VENRWPKTCDVAGRTSTDISGARPGRVRPESGLADSDPKSQTTGVYPIDAESAMVEKSALPTDQRQLHELVEALRSEIEARRRLQDEERQRRKQIERELREAQAVYLSLVETLPVSLIRKDRQGRLVFVNKPVIDEYGKSLEELKGLTDFDLFPPELATKYRADDQKVIQTQKVFEDVEAHTTPDGEQRYVHVIKAPVIDSHGEVVGVQAVFWDETDRVRAEEELKASEARKRAIFETSLDCLIISDENGKIVEFNGAAEKTFEYSREEALGQDMDALLFAHPADEDVNGEIECLSLLKHHSSMLGKRLEVPLVRRSGEEFIAEMAMQPIPLAGTVHYATVLHDITGRKAAERELQKAKNDAETANQAKSAFLANMSHEIRTPMNAILGMTGLVLDSDLSPDHREHLSIVRDSAESLLALINDILDFSKIEAGRLDLHAAPFALRDRIGDTMKSLNVRAYEKRIELACHVAPDVPEYLHGDIGRLRQVIINLVGNAIKFTDRGEVVLDVRVAEASDEDVVLHFETRDTGIGIPADQHEQVFGIFEQVDPGPTRRYGGTGLGLAISRRLVALMGGELWLESSPGVGSRFHFTARFGLADEIEPPERHRAVESLHGLSVLVVDDNATNRRILDEMLSNWGMKVQLAAGTREAMEKLRQSRSEGTVFQLIVTDVNMPESDGFDLVEQIRADKQLAAMTIMLLTSGDRVGDFERCEQLSVSRYMTKPVKQSELLDAIGAAFHVVPLTSESRPRPLEQRDHIRALRILLAEDSIPNQKLAIGLLRKFDHQITVVGNGRDALEQWKSQAFDLILMDVAMPELDGLAATQQIRQFEAARGDGAAIPIVAMTAHAMKGDDQVCLNAGMNAYVAKPIRPDELFRAIDRLCAHLKSPAKETTNMTTPANPSGESGVNWTAALNVVQNDVDLLREVVEAVLEETPQLLDALPPALTAGDAKTVQRLAHTIKGNMRTFEFNAGMETAETLERNARAGDLSQGRELADRLAEQTAAFLRELTESPYAGGAGTS
jgi:two-component system, sensor histidine kinase and response regulator